MCGRNWCAVIDIPTWQTAEPHQSPVKLVLELHLQQGVELPSGPRTASASSLRKCNTALKMFLVILKECVVNEQLNSDFYFFFFLFSDLKAYII